MQFQHETGRFFTEADGKLQAEVTYKIQEEPKIFTIDHTYVDPALRGHNVAEDLVNAVVDLAREEGYKVKPQCRYAVVLFRRYQEKYQDVQV
ncbi:GNAT family N-acetyltransferase [Eupransor demetentiae]|uniref:GNAT superfamily (YidJ) n=1 Tax=Eupransor demetentiae TaxID=3109584 RepID=A0ABM9N7I8_9LACO|nr:GNAT superfamily (YidJ) [Lactobacillaceae bacterium LMG 33000]